jgi:hypothetical protein
VGLAVATQGPVSAIVGTPWTYYGAASAQAALSDGLDTTWVQTTSRSLLDAEVLRLGFTIPTLPTGAKIYSLGIRRRTRTVAAGSNRPVCEHWFRSAVPASVGSTSSTPVVYKYQFISLGPVSELPTSGGIAATQWVDETIATFTTAPDGTGWDAATNLVAFTYDMGRSDSYGTLLQIADVRLDITFQQQSTITITGPVTPTAGTRPAILWTYYSPDSQPQQAYQAALYTLAQTLLPGFQPFVTPAVQGTDGFVLGDDQQWIPDTDLADDTYVAYVQAKSKWGGLGDFLTPVASYSFTRSASTGGAGTYPPPATLSSAVFSETTNRVALTIVPSLSSPVTTSFTVFALREGEVQFKPIPSLTYVPANGTFPVTVYDYVAPINKTSQYKVLAYGPSTTAPVAAATFSSTLSVLTSGSLWWLKDPQNPLANTSIFVLAEGNKIMRRRVQGTFEVLSGSGSVKAVVVNGPVYGETGTLMLGFRWDEPDYFTAWDALDKSGHVLLLQKSTGEQLFVTLGPGSQGQETSWEYQSIDPSTVQWRKATVSYTEVDTPAYY